MIINNKKIGLDAPPYIIAEMSANHNNDIENAKKLIEEAKKNGADAIKLQTYKPDTITLNSSHEDFIIKDNGLWHGRTLYDLYEEAHMPWDWHKPLFEFANKLGLTIFSSPFDRTAVDLLEELNAPAYKIASFEIVDIPLIQYVASTNKPIIISTGMANEEEIFEAIDAVKSSGTSDIAILHCVSSYPAKPSEYNLKTIEDMRKKFKVEVGISDHTIDNVTAISSIAFGCTLIEKHFTLDRNAGGPDDSFSMEPSQLMSLSKDIKNAHKAVGKINYSLKNNEKTNIKFRRSLYFVKDLSKGAIISEDDIASVRPGYGVLPKHYHEIIGKTVNKDISKHTAVNFDDISN